MGGENVFNTFGLIEVILDAGNMLPTLGQCQPPRVDTREDYALHCDKDGFRNELELSSSGLVDFVDVCPANRV
jgi:hypothetical protein